MELQPPEPPGRPLPLSFKNGVCEERSIEIRHLIVTKLPVGFDHSSSKVHKIEHLLYKIELKIGLFPLTAGMQPLKECQVFEQKKQKTK